MSYQVKIDAHGEDKNTPGSVGAWVLIWVELTEFALFFLVFLVARAHNPDLFHEGPTRLNTIAGALNTLILITSSYCVARAVSAIKQGNRQACLRWLYGTLGMGVAYSLVKFWEYYWNDLAGLSLRTDIYYSLYYYLTFNHFLHVIMGMMVIGWVCVNTHLGHYSKEDHGGLESGASYWHMIDLVWIIIFPLLYVFR
ncbi:cytochrome c oxidase subunit 3 family protein [Aestuariirhabdus sp. Z084]|uniref:cytochrome c oxidase subunit 3 family protein n=1 Tax=Aestuariirhabdus haliotis TaxID=2918751 RepID=UPI00201B454C|nr:cytochrome c oxidase subunit 3 family protein [Aestuariirhabdus haliotis]MCL6416591.1 cytochrome c oxidase subunit 3 family protein [Aestuariirhabdus haliotis]MCL6420542.1 cytochrome c oxidase subunit 3 family protein [Aestuariirhabdus haliotis]